MATLYSLLKALIEVATEWTAASMVAPTVEDGDRKSTSKYPHTIFIERGLPDPEIATSDASLQKITTPFFLHVHEINITNLDKTIAVLMDKINNKNDHTNKNWVLLGPISEDHLQRREISTLRGYEVKYNTTGVWP